MRVLVAFDKFKEALTAPEACAIAAEALQDALTDPELDLCPLTDGGDGFASILTRAAGGELISREVTGAAGQRQPAAFGIVTYDRIPPDARDHLRFPAAKIGRIALVEMAAASGLASIPLSQRDPWTATSWGTGELIRAAAEAGVDGIVVGIGGSATNDLGFGALAALGWRCLDANGKPVLPPTPGRFAEIARLERTDLILPPIRVACDVTNPLLGEQGATRVFGPQKGLRPGDGDRLEAAVARGASLLCTCQHASELAAREPGSGAAGGMGFGLRIACGAGLVPGADLIAAWLRLDQRVQRAELVLTGEGRFDSTSLSGKGPGAVIHRAAAAHRRVHVFAGKVGPDVAPSPSLLLHAITPEDMPLARALAQTRTLLRRSIEQVLREIRPHA